MVGPLNPKYKHCSCNERIRDSKSGDLLRTIYGGESLCNPYGDQPMPCSDGPVPNVL